MSWKLLLAMIAVVLIIAGCGDGGGGFKYNGLSWQVGPDQDMTWDEAKAWVDGLGGNWRMPAQAELQGLWDAGVRSDNWGPFENGGKGVWYGEDRNTSSVWYFDLEGWLDRGCECCSPTPLPTTFARAFAVRSR